MLARLEPIDGGQAIELDREITLIGRDDACDIHIPDRTLSKRHCVLAVSDGFAIVRDLVSTNGVHVNGVKVQRGILFPGDRLKLGKFHFKYSFSVMSTSPS